MNFSREGPSAGLGCLQRTTVHIHAHTNTSHAHTHTHIVSCTCPDLLFPGQPSPAVRPPRPPPPSPQPGAGNLRVSLGSNLLHASRLIRHQVLQLSPPCDFARVPLLLCPPHPSPFPLTFLTWAGAVATPHSFPPLHPPPRLMLLVPRLECMRTPSVAPRWQQVKSEPRAQEPLGKCLQHTHPWADMLAG